MHVDVLADLVRLQHLTHRLIEVDVAVRHREAHHLHRLAQPREVLGEAEAVHLAVGGVPVGAQPLEAVRGVKDRRAVDRQHGLLAGHHLPVHPDLEIGHRHAPRARRRALT